MRLRKIAGADEAVASHERVIKPAEQKADWLKQLSGEKPVYLEIGMGKGDFAIGMARKHRDVVFLGLEKYSSVLLKAIQKYDKLQDKPSNLWFLWENALDLTEIFPVKTLDRIYLNFSDPWPKERYAKRRLTAPAFLEKYHPILKPECRLEFKTDNEGLFRYSIESFECCSKFQLEKVIWDLHQEVSPAENIMTEYEQKFSGLGHPIFKLEAVSISG